MFEWKKFNDVRVTPGDPECNDVLRLDGMDNDFLDPEPNNILRLEGMRWVSGLLILINNGFTLFVFVIFRYLYIIRCYSAEQPKDTGVFSCPRCLRSLKVVRCRSVQSGCLHYMPHGLSSTLDYMKLRYYITLEQARYITQLLLLIRRKE